MVRMNQSSKEHLISMKPTKHGNKFRITYRCPNYRRYRHTSGNGRKERTHAKNEQETAAGMVFFPAASESREFHLRPYHIQ